MMQGELDPSTPYYQVNNYFRLIFLHINEQVEELSSMMPNRLFVRVPLAGHVTSLLSSVGIFCPLQIILEFTLTGQVNTSCIAAMPSTIDYAGTSTQVQD